VEIREKNISDCQGTVRGRNTPRKCWEVIDCREQECPAYESENLQCWLISETRCYHSIQNNFLDKIELCIGCDFFVDNIDVKSIKETLKIVDGQFKEFRRIVHERDNELESIGIELAISLSEVFEALRKIAACDPSVNIPEDSPIELISMLKHVVNKTAEEIKESINLSHEFAICLAEHFDVLHRVSRGDLNARVSGGSSVELLDSLRNVTNEMIVDISADISKRMSMEE